MQLVAAAHGAHELEVVFLGIERHGEFGRDGVDGVDHVVDVPAGRVDHLAKERVDVLGQDVIGAFDDGGLGVDIVNHGFHHIDLATSQRAVERDGLAVDVARGEHVLVEDDKVPDTAACERFAAVGAHTAAAEHEHACVGEFVERLAPHDDLEFGVAGLGSLRGVFAHERGLPSVNLIN